MSVEQPDELHQLREEVRQLQQRLAEINRKLDQLARPEPPPLPAPPVIPSVPRAPAPLPSPKPVMDEFDLPPFPQPATEASSVMAPPPIDRAPKESFEVRLGTYWLPRIGMAVLLTGIVFLVTWSYHYLSLGHKVAMGYLWCLVLGGLGLWLEKKMPQFARVLQAGSLALAYFVTYAAHFVEAFRVIQSPALALTLLTLVVVAIVGVAQERQSAALAGMALFFGYYTSVISGVTSFTLASNAVLAVAALFFLARNRWVHISYGAVLATYLTYLIWVWKLNRFGDMERLVFDSAYLGESDFRLRAAFLSLYWLLFTVGALIVRREVLATAERNGLFALNNAFFFLLFTLLMYHAHPQMQWEFQFCFGGALLITSAIAYRRFQAERLLMDTLFVQGLAVATLGGISYFKGVHLVAALTLESAFVLILARTMRSRWVAWIGRATFAWAGLYAWSEYPEWDAPMIWGVVFAAAAGFFCARLERRRLEEANHPTPWYSALYFALLSTVLAMLATNQHFSGERLPWAWIVLAVLCALIGGALRTREIFWASQLPLVWANISFYLAKFDDERWPLWQSIALIAATFGFGVFVWRRARKAAVATDGLLTASNLLLVYAIAATAALIVVTFDHCPGRWQLVAFAVETFAFVVAGLLASEVTFGWASLSTLIVGSVGFFLRGRHPYDLGGVGWSNAMLALGVLGLAERTLKSGGQSLGWSEGELRGVRAVFAGFITALAIVALDRLVGHAYLTVGWAVCGFALLALGFAFKERLYRIGGLVVLALSLARAVLYDLSNLETLYRILSFIGLGAILLVLAFLYTRNREKLAKWL